MGSPIIIDGLVCNDFSPQARLAAALAKKLKSVGKVKTTTNPAPDVEKEKAKNRSIAEGQIKMFDADPNPKGRNLEQYKASRQYWIDELAKNK